MWLFISKDLSETPSYGVFLNKTLLKRWQTQQSLPRVSEHARISEINPEKHSLLESVIEDIFEMCENNVTVYALSLMSAYGYKGAKSFLMIL